MRAIFKCTNPSCGIDLVIDDANISLDNPRVRCSKCKVVIDLKEHITGETPLNEIQIEEDNDKPLAWLVVHDENTYRQVFNLKAGKHVVGRQNNTKPCDIMIRCDKDPYMSRNHCVLEVRRNLTGLVEVLLSDNKSTNGTWLNAEKKLALKDGEKIFLEDNDMLQLGLTKVIVKIKQGKVRSRSVASEEVFRKKYGKTRIIDD